MAPVPYHDPVMVHCPDGQRMWEPPSAAPAAPARMAKTIWRGVICMSEQGTTPTGWLFHDGDDDFESGCPFCSVDFPGLIAQKQLLEIGVRLGRSGRGLLTEQTVVGRLIRVRIQNAQRLREIGVVHL